MAAELLAASAASLAGEEDSMPAEAAPDMVRAGRATRAAVPR